MMKCQAFGLIAALVLASTVATAAEATKEAGVDANAMAAVNKMSAALNAHKTFILKADVSDEDVLDSGQKLQFAATVEIKAQRPDRFKLAVVSDAQAREIYYDGKAITVFSPRLGMYASFAAPPTIREAVERARTRYDIELPLADLFSWATDKTMAERVTSAFLVRPERVAGQTCDHYAFRQADVDWQIWIAQGATALPCKLVITDRSDPSLPQYTAVLHWSFPDTIASDVFAFTPPAKAHKIVINEVDVARKLKTKGYNP
jgi:hypothetical protein